MKKPKPPILRPLRTSLKKKKILPKNHVGYKITKLYKRNINEQPNRKSNESSKLPTGGIYQIGFGEEKGTYFLHRSGPKPFFGSNG